MLQLIHRFILHTIFCFRQKDDTFLGEFFIHFYLIVFCCLPNSFNLNANFSAKKIDIYVIEIVWAGWGGRGKYRGRMVRAFFFTFV